MILDVPSNLNHCMILCMGLSILEVIGCQLIVIMPNEIGEFTELEDITKIMYVSGDLNKRPFSRKLKNCFTGVTFSKGQENSFIKITGGKSCL